MLFQDAEAAKGLGRRDDDVASILAALQTESPEVSVNDCHFQSFLSGMVLTDFWTLKDAAAAQDAAEPDTKKRDDDVAAILAALQTESPDDAAAAQSAVEPDTEKRQEDVASILAALSQESPEDAEAAAGAI